MTLLSVANVSKAYAGVPALVDASLELAAGEVHALMGENGAGKIDADQDPGRRRRADSATIAIDGAEVRLDSPHAAFAHGLRFIHQELNVVPQLSVAENIFLGQPYPRRLRRARRLEGDQPPRARGARPAADFEHRAAAERWRG